MKRNGEMGILEGEGEDAEVKAKRNRRRIVAEKEEEK